MQSTARTKLSSSFAILPTNLAASVLAKRTAQAAMAPTWRRSSTSDYDGAREAARQAARRRRDIYIQIRGEFGYSIGLAHVLTCRFHVAHLSTIYPTYPSLVVRSQQTPGVGGCMNYVAVVLYVYFLFSPWRSWLAVVPHVLALIRAAYAASQLRSLYFSTRSCSSVISIAHGSPPSYEHAQSRRLSSDNPVINYDAQYYDDRLLAAGDMARFTVLLNGTPGVDQTEGMERLLERIEVLVRSGWQSTG